MDVKREVKTFKKEGWELVRQKGSHMIYQKDKKTCPIPNHKGDIPKGTLANIVRITGVKLQPLILIKKFYQNVHLKTMETYFYPAKFKKEENSYSVEFIDFDNIFTFGNDFRDAYFMAQDVLFNMLPEYEKNLSQH